MKNPVFIITLLLILALLSACASNESNISIDADNQSYSEPGLISGSDQTAYDVQYIRIGSGFGPRSPVCTIISSVDELNRYSGNLYNGAFWETEYSDKTAKYNDNFFTDNFLVIVFLEEISGSNRHNVESVDEYGNIVIEQLIPEIGTSDMATWNIIIELNNSFKAEQFQVILK